MEQHNPPITWGWVQLEHLRVDRARLGVLPKERRSSQPVIVHVAFEVPTGLVAATNRLELSADYRTIAQVVRQIVALRHYDLLEAMAEQLADGLWQRFPYARQLQLQLCKPQSIPGAMASVRVCRRRPHPLPTSVFSQELGL